MEPWRLREDGWDPRNPQGWGDRAGALSPDGCTSPGTRGDDYFFTLHRCGSRWTFIFALNAKTHRGGYPLPQINPFFFWGGGVERQGFGGGPAGQVKPRLSSPW